MISRHGDAMALIPVPAALSFDKGGTCRGTGPSDAQRVGKFLIWSGDPRQKQLRGLVNKDFANRAVHDFDAKLRRRAGNLIGSLA